MCRRPGPLRLQSVPAPGAGVLRLALLELEPAAVLARIGASQEMRVFKSYQLWLDIFAFPLGCR